MKTNFAAAELFLTLTSDIEQVKRLKADVTINFIVANNRPVQHYLKGMISGENDFNSYDFQFYRDHTIVGTNRTVSKTGTCSGDVAFTSTPDLFAHCNTLLTRSNKRWDIRYCDEKKIKDNQIINGVKQKLILRKK